jgi:hypothetical protein
MTNAANTPGTHPASVSSVVIRIEPHPLSSTARGGRRTQMIALPQLILTSSLMA